MVSLFGPVLTRSLSTERAQDAAFGSGPGPAGLPAMLGMGPGGMPKRASGIDANAIQQVCFARVKKKVTSLHLYQRVVSLYMYMLSQNPRPYWRLRTEMSRSHKKTRIHFPPFLPWQGYVP